jgi:zinc protease
VLTRGESSRLYQAMVYDQQIAAQVFSSFPTNRDPGAYSLVAVMSEGKTADEGLASLKAEIDRMRTTPVTQAELDEARNELLMETLDERETADGRANELAFSVVMFDDPDASDKRLAQLQSVTAADIQRVAAAIMDDTRSTTLRYLPESQTPGAESAKIADSPTIQATTISIPADQIPTYALAPEETRVRPPVEGAPVSAAIPTFEETTLANGLRVVVASRPGLPLVSASLRLGAGAALDPAGKSGLASMAADLASRGTATRTATQIAQEIESLGADLGSSAGMDASDVSVSTRSDKAKDVLAIMADVVMNPSFAQEELDRARAETLDGLRVSMRQPPAVAGMVMSRALYGFAPYGGVMTEATVSALDRDSIVAFHATHWRPDDAVLVITGNVTPAEGQALAEGAFGAWKKPETPIPDQPDADEAPGATGPRTPTATIVDIPGIGQATVTLGQFGPSRLNPRYFQTLVANDVLGGGYSARLNSEIRIKRGLSYGVRSGLPSRKARSAIVASAQTGNPDVPTVLDLLSGELKRLGAEPIPEAELNARKAVLVGSFGRSVETNAGLAGQLSALAQFGLPLEKLSTYSTDILAVTADQAAEAARAYYDPAKASVVIVGDAKAFWTAVKKRLPAARRIDIDTLDLERADLQ